jgi:hypothetical protein
VARAVNDPVGARSLLGPLQRGRCFASHHVLTELYQPDKLGYRNKWDKLAAQGAANGGSTKPADYRGAFEAWLPGITFVDVTGMFEDSDPAQAVYRSDPHDAPTGQLAVLLSRTRLIVYSHDRSLWKPGLAPSPTNFQAVIAAGRQVDSAETVAQGAAYVAGGAVWMVNGAARGVAGVLKVPSWVPWLLLVLGAAWYLLGKERRARVVGVLAPVGRILEAQMARSTEALAVLADSVAQVDPDERLECRVAEVLAVEPPDSALTASEIAERLDVGQKPPLEGASAPADLRARLRQLPCFREGPSGRFRLGTTYDLDAG